LSDLGHLRGIHAATVDLESGQAGLDLAKIRWRVIALMTILPGAFHLD
jgi:hypothetical protein